MSHLLPGEKLEEQLPKLLPGVLALYKKHAETFHVSKVHTCTPWPVQSSVPGTGPQLVGMGGCSTWEGWLRVLLEAVVGGAQSHLSLPCPALPRGPSLGYAACPETCPPLLILDLDVGVPYLSPGVGSLWPGGGAGGLK